MNGAKSPEFDPKRPLASAGALLREIFLRPRAFYVNFDTGGPVREPAIFVLLISAVSGVLSMIANLISTATDFGAADTSLLGVLAVNLNFIVLSPILVGGAAGAYWLSVRAFIGSEGNFRELYRMLAYAYGAMILFPLPVINAFAYTYMAMILMGLGIWNVYRTSFITALVTTLAGFVPVSVAFIYLLGAAITLVSG